MTFELEKVLIRLGSNIPDFKTVINDLKTQTIDPRREAEHLKEVSLLNAKCESLEVREQKVEHMHKTIEDLQQKHNTMNQKQENMQQQLATMAIEQPNNTLTTEDLRKVLLSAYEGTCQRITIFPEMTLDLEELYVEQEFKLIDQSRKVEDPNEQNCESNRISSVADIFNKDGRICKNILISSEAGVGKSTFCKYLVRLWYNGHTKQYEKLTEDQKTMNGFNLLFFIDLRDATIPPETPRSDEIAMLIHDLLDLSDICSITDIRRFLSDSSNLVVMDSLDELGSIRFPRRGLHNKSCIVTASRPWKIESLRSTFTDFHQHIEIVGLMKDSQLALAKKVLQLLNKDSSEMNAAHNFYWDMAKDKMLHLLNSPMLAIQMIGLWFSGETFGDSQFEIYSKVIHNQICNTVNTKSLPKVEGGCSTLDFPFCNGNDQCPCKDYGTLLWKVAKLAFHTLISNEREILVLGHEVARFHELTTEEGELCLKIGILTQHKFFVKNPIVKKKQVRFPHKTNLEYFAAIFLSSEDETNALEELCSVVSDLDRSLELEKVLFFCNQVNHGVALHLSKFIYEKAEEDHRVQEYRHSYHNRDNAPYADLVTKLQNIIIPATHQNAELFLSDICMYNPYMYALNRTSNNDPDNQGLIVGIHRLDVMGLKSIHVQDFHNMTSDVLDTLTQSQHLQKIVMDNSFLQVESIQKLIVKNQDTLRTLRLAGQFIAPLDMSPLGEKLRDTFTAKLTFLALSCVKLTHQQCQYISEFFISSHSLSQVELSRMSCETHGKTGECFELDFTRHTALQTIKFDSLPVVAFSLYPQSLQIYEILYPLNLSAQTSMLNCRESARDLPDLKLLYNKNTHQLLKILPELVSLQKLVLVGVDFVNLMHIRASAKMEKLEYVKLSKCTITSEGLHSFISSLPGHMVVVELEHVNSNGNFCHHIRNSSNTKVTQDEVAELVDDEWLALAFIFENNNGKRQD